MPARTPRSWQRWRTGSRRGSSSATSACCCRRLRLLIVLVRRRGAWRGRQAVFWAAIGAWAALWFIGQVGWASDELFRSTPLPWFKWHIILQLCGSALPLIALVAWPHRAAADETAITVALDIAVLVFLTGFLYWSLIIAPGCGPGAIVVRTAHARDCRADREAGGGRRPPAGGGGRGKQRVGDSLSAACAGAGPGVRGARGRFRLPRSGATTAPGR